MKKVEVSGRGIAVAIFLIVVGGLIQQVYPNTILGRVIAFLFVVIGLISTIFGVQIKLRDQSPPPPVAAPPLNIPPRRVRPITPAPPPRRVHTRAPSPKTSLPKRITYFVLLIVILLGGAGILLHIGQGTPPLGKEQVLLMGGEPALFPFPTPTSLVASAANVGAMPQNCPLGPTPKNVDPSQFGPSVGGSPVWAIGFAGPHATAHLKGSSEDALSVQYGWEYKILWSVGPNYTHPVVLRGGLLSGRTSLWFQIGAQTPTTAPVLDPRYPGTITGSDAGWAEFPSYLLIPKAGCYYLEAQWQEEVGVFPSQRVCREKRKAY